MQGVEIVFHLSLFILYLYYYLTGLSVVRFHFYFLLMCLVDHGIIKRFGFGFGFGLEETLKIT